MLATEDEKTAPPAEQPNAAALDTTLITAMDRTISRYQRSLRHAIEQAEGPERLTMPQLRCLQAMMADDTALTTQLARRMKVAVPTMTSMIDGLAERGLVARHPDPADRRQVRIVMTDEGRAVLGRYQAIMHARLRTLIAHLTTAQKKRLLAAIEDVAMMLDADASDRHAREKPKESD
ncbi:MAG: MarR family transcriptional regulator [Thermomicrobia bacterium]|nr:MarR family transcriptional regulator [Thermomicrobia bacterium]